MPKERARKTTDSDFSEEGNSQERDELLERDDHIQRIVLPNANDSGDSDDFDDFEDGSDERKSSLDEDEFDEEDLDDELGESFNSSFRQMAQKYTESQKKLEGNHEYLWENGEKKCTEPLENKILLSDKDKKLIFSSLPTELFEFFFSKELKEHIIDCSKVNELDLTLKDFDAFVGILIYSTFNKRLAQRDYWSLDSDLRSTKVANAMSRNRFEQIKSKIKYHKPENADLDDKIWRVRPMFDIFRNNLRKFGVFSTALSIDEMMCKYFGRSSLKQFIKEQLTSKTSPRKLSMYHIYFDNLFCCPDLLVHLKKGGLRATGTVKANRIKEQNSIAKDAPRAAGATPETPFKRYLRERKKKDYIPFPKAVTIYNQFMGGVDLHDMYCNRVMPIFRSKKWTWIIFIRIIQSSPTNATILWNTACSSDKKLAIKDFALSVAKKYLSSEKSDEHVMTKTGSYKNCSKRCGTLIYPTKWVINTDLRSRMVMGRNKVIPCDNSLQRIFLKPVLSKYLQLPNVFNSIINQLETTNESGVLNSIVDGSHRSINKIGAIYYAIAFLPL
ncbi:piggyBac transposable element-derived protein 3-like [Prorops nasuta]|uniref:piggyBac transposable element-derived protein 3-like n=1 Tax=Prorops nasuta TaxID=863751 RepID=UPI0034CF6664